MSLIHDIEKFLRAFDHESYGIDLSMVDQRWETDIALEVTKLVGAEIAQAVQNWNGITL